MRHWFMGLTVALTAAGAGAADEKAAAVVRKAIEAHGGADNLNRYNAGRYKMAGTLSLMGMDFEFTGRLAYMPDRFKMVMTSAVAGRGLVITQVFNGEKFKHAVTLDGEPLPTPQTEAVKEDLRLTAVLQEAERLTPLLNAKRFAVKAGEDAAVNGKAAAVVVVQPKAVTMEFNLYFDKESGLLAMTRHKGGMPGPDGQPVEVEVRSVVSDHKPVRGVQVPTRIVIQHNGKTFMSVRLSEYELTDKIDDKEFTTD